MHILAAELEDLPSGLRAVLDYWDELRRARKAPAWSEVDMMRFPARLLPTTMIVDVHEPLEDSVFRYWGSRLSEIHGEDMTARCPYDLQPYEFGQQLLRDHRAVVENKRPLAWHYSFLASGGYMHSHSVLRLPLSNDDDSVHHIIVVVDFSREALELMHRKQETYAGIVSRK